MIYVVNHHSEYDPTAPTYRYYSEAIGYKNMRLICAEELETFDFLTADDVVIVRSGNIGMLRAIQRAQDKIGFISTAESIEMLDYSWDKVGVKIKVLEGAGIPTPKAFDLLEVDDNSAYFVKPRFGEGGKYIDDKSLCTTKRAVCEKYAELGAKGKNPMIEQYISGYDATASVIANGLTGEVSVYAVDIITESPTDVQTYERKQFSVSYCQPSTNKRIEGMARKAFKALGAKHYLRLDFRVSADGTPYLIDINLFPGFGMTEYMYRSLMLCANKSYRDFIKDIIASAS